MIELYPLMLIIVLHFICDFIIQNDYVAQNKSKHNGILAWHVTLYSIPFIAVGGFLYAAVNWVLHFITDYISSRLTTYFWKKEDRHNFFVVVGADQAVHMVCLILTYIWLIQ